ncbi:Sensor histidine kinase RcsC [Streptomyces violarus]
MDVSPTRIALVQLVDYVEATFRPLTAEKGLDLSVRVSPELPATLHTDEQRLLQVLRNLLSNAVKFTDSGSVELVIRPARDDVPQKIREQLLETGSLTDPDAELIAFSVTDTGIGIASSKMRVIFEAFKQADGTTSRKIGGTGLGLSISRRLPSCSAVRFTRRASRAAARRSRCTCRCTPANCRRRATSSSSRPAAW